VLQKVVVKVLTSQVSISSSGLDSEDTTADVEKGDIEGSSSKIEDQDILLGLGLTIETIGDGGCCRFVDDTENIKTGNGTRVLGGKTLGIIEVGRNTERKLQSVSWKVERMTHVTTAFFTVLPSLASEISFILERTIEEISWGLKVFSSPRY